MSDNALREMLCSTGRSLFARGLTHGSTGNLSLRTDRGFIMTPTGCSLGELDPARLAVLDANGTHVQGDAPTKEALLHLAMYRQRPRDGAVVHLHSTHSVAVSILADTNPDDALPPLTAYYAMRVGRLPMLPYLPPGDPGSPQRSAPLPPATTRCCSPIMDLCYQECRSRLRWMLWRNSRQRRSFG